MGSKMEPDVNIHVWAPHDTEGFILCKIIDVGYDRLTLQPVNGGITFEAFYDSIYPAEEDPYRDVNDNCSLMYLNDATILHNCRLRYYRKQLYTYVANILIVINPYEQIPGLYDNEMIQRYKGKSLGILPPHIFAIADKAYRDMMRNRESQSVIVSGESGAGKTESQKHIIRFLCESWGEFGGTIEQRILQISTILESFGNAKTLRNNNSSRFGKFIEIHFDDKGAIIGGYVSHYLLERSRLCGQHPTERNYHIFYQLLAGADDQLVKKLQLDCPEKFNYLNKGCKLFFLNNKNVCDLLVGNKTQQSYAIEDDLIDDYNDFQKLLNAFNQINASVDDQNTVLEAVAAILHLGNIEFMDDISGFNETCFLKASSGEHLRNAAELLGLESNDLKSRLLTRIMQPTRGGIKGTLYAVPLRANEASAARDGLAKAIYCRLFDAIVTKITKCMPCDNSAFSIGVLDTAGFEALNVNSYEQFCINYCNEKLQNFFYERIILDEQKLYCEEQLDCEAIEFDNNQNCIELYEEKFFGILDLLDNESRVPRPSPITFTSSVQKNHREHPCLKTPIEAGKGHLLGDDKGFIICHYAADVCYDTSQFLEKNNDALHASLQCLMQQSKKKLISEMFDYNESFTEKQKLPKNKLVAPTVAYKFRKQLETLLNKLRKTGTHFVRCIKPNSEMKPHHFHGGQILMQLKCTGMSSVLKAMQRGFPSRVSYQSLCNMYRKYLPDRFAMIDDQLLCKCLFRAIGFQTNDYKFGLTKAFFRHGKFAEFDQMVRQDEENIKNLIGQISSWLCRYRFRKIQFAVLTLVKVERWLKYKSKCRILIQKTIRGYLIRKAYRARINIMKSMVLKCTNDVILLIDKLNNSAPSELAAIIGSLKEDFTNLRQDIEILHGSNYGQSYHQFIALVDKTKQKLRGLKQQVIDQEMEKIQVEKELNRLQEEQKLVKNVELEQIQHSEAKLQQQNESQDTVYSVECPKPTEVTEQKKPLLNEQKKEEKHQQIAKDSDESLELTESTEQKEYPLKEHEKGRNYQQTTQHSKEVLKPEDSVVQEEVLLKKSETNAYDLSKWCYIDLRNGVNSSDPALSAACTNEYHRRMREYKNWKEKSMASKGIHYKISEGRQKQNQPVVTKNQYFRIAASSLTNREKNLLGIAGKSELTIWYGHFKDGRICRHLEISPKYRPISRIAGTDDKTVYRKVLQTTNFCKQKGTEITATEFARIWAENVNKPFEDDK